MAMVALVKRELPKQWFYSKKRRQMLRRESRVLGKFLENAIRKYENPLVANIGSSTLDYRTLEQPYIEKNLFSKASRDTAIIHVDAKEDSGADIVADFTSDTGFAALSKSGANLFVVCNLLEHVESIEEAVTKLNLLIQPGQLLVASGPKNFPYHPDPIDNMFRPDRRELEDLFSEFRLIDWKVARHLTLFGSIAPTAIDVIKTGARYFSPRNLSRRKIRYAFSPVSAWCAILEKRPHL